MARPAQAEEESTFVYLPFASEEMPGQDRSLFVKFQGIRVCSFSSSKMLAV